VVRVLACDNIIEHAEQYLFRLHMSKSRIQVLFNQAENREKTHNWVGAANCFARIGSLTTTMAFFEKATILENAGYALCRAAFQAESNEEFRARCKRPIKSYEKAVHYFLRSEEVQRALGRC